MIRDSMLDHLIKNDHIDNNLKFNVHVKFTAAKANSILFQLKRTLRYWTPITFKAIYTPYICPHLEYVAPVWSSYRKRDITMLEKVQRRATKIVPCLKRLS